MFAASNSCLALQGSSAWFVTGGGERARIFSSDDKGLHWKVAETTVKTGNQSSGLFSIAFRNEQLGIAVGGDFKAPHQFPSDNILVTRNGGENWDPIHSQGLSGLYLSCASWLQDQNDKVLVVEGASITIALNTAVSGEQYFWAVGPQGTFARIHK